MKTYIRKSISGYYIEFTEEIDSEYWEGKIGYNYQDFLDDKWVLLSNEQVAFHEEYPSASIEEVLDMALKPRTVEDAKKEMITTIEDYDGSDIINSFNIVLGGNTISAWLTPDQRANYRNSIDAAKLIGLEELHPIFNGIQLTISTAKAELALAQIQLYADRCYIVTETHKAEVNALDSVEAIDNYDYTAGYPDRLTFNLDSI